MQLYNRYVPSVHCHSNCSYVGMCRYGCDGGHSLSGDRETCGIISAGIIFPWDFTPIYS